MIKNLYLSWVAVLNKLQHVLLLAIRLYWGIGFMQTGLGKFRNFERTVDFFTSLNIPAPSVNAFMASGTEFIGGLCLALGLGGRVMTVPLVFTMIVAYATAEREALLAIFSEPDKFTAADPFLFLLAALIVLCFGPGALSLDYLIGRYLNRKK